MPGCHDAMSARLIEEAGFELGFMSGFAVSAARLGMPDTGLISYAELADQAQNICRAVSIPLIGDGDTGFGSAQNIKRTVAGYARAGFAAIMLEDQVAPKRCGHTEGKTVVARDEALTRIRAAVDARNEGADILIMARTDARAVVSLDEAIARCQAFRALGADITFLEAPLGVEEMRRYCQEVDGPKMANLIEGGKTPLLPHAELEAIGYKIAVYPLTMLNVSIVAMRAALQQLARGQATAAMTFEDLKRAVGFPEYTRKKRGTRTWLQAFRPASLPSAFPAAPRRARAGSSGCSRRRCTRSARRRADTRSGCVTLNGRVYALGSSTVISMSMWPKSFRTKRSVTRRLSVAGFPLLSSHTLSLKPALSPRTRRPPTFPPSSRTTRDSGPSAAIVRP